MSVDPGAAAAAGAASPAQVALDALLVAELNALAADAQALQAQLTVGDVVTATVLPPNGLTDLLSINGNRVAAALPPNLVPGDTVTVQVTGFNGTQIQLQMLGTAEPPTTNATAAASTQTSNALATAATPAPPGLAPGPDEGALAAAARNPLGLTPELAALAPPVAVFVAASVTPSTATVATNDEPETGAPIPSGGPPPAATAEATIAGPAVTPAAAGIVEGPLAAIEARMAAARAGQLTVGFPFLRAPNAPPLPPSAPSAPTPNAPANAQSAAQTSNAANAPAARGAAPAPPPIAPRPTSYVAPPIVTSARSLNAGAAAANSETDPTGLQAFNDPVALVRALQLPTTPTNIAAAQLALSVPQRLPAALATLERALPSSDDPRVMTLRTITSFIGKLDPQSPQLASQIEAYVDHVVTGSEPKLVQLLVAQEAAEAPPEGAAAPAPAADAAPAAAAGQAATEAAPAATAAAASTAAAEAPAPASAMPLMALAQVVERVAALGSDLKTQLVQLLTCGPPVGASEEVTPAAASALTAVTAVQMNAAQNLAATPQQMQFVLPMWVGNGYAQARISVDRDAPEQQHVPLDGDNFHIAFVLDTKNIGTVMVDLVSVGRSFSLKVKTENPATADRFAGAMDRLTDRLATLKYTVNSAEAHVAPPLEPAAATAAAETAAPDDDNALGTMSATA